MARTHFAGDDPGALPPVNPRGTAFPAACVGAARRDPVRPADHVRLESRVASKSRRELVRRRAPWQRRRPQPHLHHPAVPSRGGSTGSLTGYAGGLEKKIALLGIEGIDVDALSMPKKGVAL